MRNNINVQYYENEFEELNKMKNSLLHFHKINADRFTEMYHEAYSQIYKDAKRCCDSIMNQIYYLQKVDGNNGYVNFKILNEDTKTKRIHKTMTKPINHIFYAVALRMAAIRLLVDVYEPMDLLEVKQSAAIVEIGKKFAYHAETNIGWRNKVTFVAGTPGELKIVDTPEKSWNGTRYYFEATIGVDHTYMDTVVANDIQLVDIGGKTVATVWAEEIEDHELKDDDVKLFKAIVAYTKVPRGTNTWRGEQGLGDKVVFVENKAIAVQPVTDGKPIIATGKDASWAIRTMRGRMKKTMLKMMDII